MELVEGVLAVEDVDAFVDRLDALGDEHGVTVQAFDARYLVDRRHLERAVELADRAIARGEAIARDRAVEILCYAAGRRQINRALELGVEAGECPAVVLVDAPPRDASEDAPETDAPPDERERAAAAAVRSMPAVEPAETLGAFDAERVRDAFDVRDPELATVDGDLASLVHERVALLVVEK
jgi:KEOPS complex subunit Cgi121